MKKLLSILIIALLIIFSSCNNSDEKIIPNPDACHNIIWSELEPQEQAIFTGYGKGVGDSFDWIVLTQQQKAEFLSFGLDSTTCYLIQP